MTTLAPFSPAPGLDRGRFVFLIHPRNNVAEDMGVIHPWLAKIPSSWWEKFFDKMPLRPIVQNRIFASDDGKLLGECVLVPLTPRQLLGRDRALVKKRMDQAIDFAHKRGATIVGLGALTASVTNGGRKLESRTDIGVTNGNAFTAAATVAATTKAASGIAAKPVIALVGATGSVGSAVSQVLGTQGIASKLILVGRNKNKLQALKDSITETEVETSTDIGSCTEAQIVVLMTSATEALLKSEHLAPNAIVIDDTQPRNTEESLVQERPDVQIIDGGMILTDGLLRKGGYWPIPNNVSFACLAETALLTLINHVGHGVIGDPTLDQVATVQKLATEYAYLGFDLADPTSFGKPIAVKGWNA